MTDQALVTFDEARRLSVLKDTYFNDILKSLTIDERRIIENTITKARAKAIHNIDQLMDYIGSLQLNDNMSINIIKAEGIMRRANPSLFNKYKLMKVLEIIVDGSKKFDTYICKCLKELFSRKILSSGKEVYFFDEHRWISGNHKKLFNICINESSMLFNSLLNVIKMGTLDLSTEQLRYLENCLSSAGIYMCSVLNVERVKSSLVSLFDLDCFDDVRDSEDIICFENGVYDTRTEVFRNGEPEDFCTLSTGVNYVKDCDTTFLMETLTKIFPDPEALDFFLMFVASCLEKGNKEKILCIFRGHSNGGKTFVCSLINSTFGNYCTRIPVTTLTGTRANGGAATPDIVTLDKKLIALTQEPSDKEKLNLGVIKELTGNESSVYCRKLFSEAKYIRITSKFVISMNPVNIATHLDEASQKRIAVIPFISKFVFDKKEVDEKKHVYLGDVRMSEKIPQLVQPFWTVILQKYSEYKKVGLQRNSAIDRATKTFFDENEPLILFMRNYYTKSVMGSVSVRVIRSTYCDWHKENFPSSRIPDLPRFRDILRLYGYKLSEDESFVKGIAGKIK